MKRLYFALVASALIATPAAAFRADNGLSVVANAPGEGFTVDWAGASGASDFWCAAGEFAIRGLGLPTGTRLYRYSPPPRRSGEGIAFGLDPARGQPTGLLRVVGGQSVTAAYARRFCEFSRFSDR